MYNLTTQECDLILRELNTMACPAFALLPWQMFATPGLGVGALAICCFTA